jgi:hypothetical protein
MEADDVAEPHEVKMQPVHEKIPGFLSGVVEGFYGRPWTLEQRKDLFIK